MTELKIAYKNNTVAYTKYGSGDQYVVCFHGFGQAGYRWAMMEPSLGKKFTLFAFDLPFHGQTAWQQDDSFTVEALAEIIQLVLPSGVQKIYLLGYSLGGRIALRLLQHIPQKVQKAVLLAPDGFHKNPWYRFATQTIAGRAIFHRFMENPSLLLSIAKRLHKKGSLGQDYYNIAQYYASDKPSRMALYHRWMSTRHFQPNLSLLKTLIGKYQIPIAMVFGKYDKIIVADRGIVFTKGLEKYATVKLLNTGHHFLREGFAPMIASFFDDDK